MKKILLAILLGIVLTACGTSSTDNGQNEQPDPNTSGSGEVTNDRQLENNSEDNEEKTEEEMGIVAGKMVPSLTETSPLLYQYQVANQTEKEVKLSFTSSQRIDYTVETRDGELIHQYSSVASFMQAMGEETVKQGEALEYTIDLNELGLSSGEYVLTTWMTTEEGPKYEFSTEFTIE